MRGLGLGLLPIVLLGGATPAAASPSAGCRFPPLNLGTFISGDRSLGNFAMDQGGLARVGSANHYHAIVSGCAATATYRLSTDTSTPVHVTNGGHSIDLVPFLVAINGTTLAMPLDLTRSNSVVLTGNPDLEIAVAVTVTNIALQPGSYNGGFVMQFMDP